MDVIVGLFKLLVWLVRTSWWLLSGAVRIMLRARSARRHAHGTARWASSLEQLWAGILGRPGLVLGRGAFRRMIRFSRDGLVMVFANTGAGKGLGIVVPNLLDYPGSMVVTDPKGENYAITAAYRRTIGPVRMLNPLDVAASDRFNPMDVIRRGTPTETDDAAGLARLLVRPDAREAHWDDKAVSTLKCFILHTLAEPAETRTLAHVRTLSVGSPETFIATLEEIAEDSASMAAREIASGILTSARNEQGFTPEFSSVLSNVQKATEPWGASTPSGLMASYSTFALDELVDSVSTIYFCVPEEFLDDYGRWMRVMVGCVLKALTRQKERAPKHKVVLLLDEVRVLGRLDQLEKQAGLLRAYCTPVLIWQNLPQIYAEYGDGAEAFLATSTCRVFFGVEDNNTAHYVANMIGNTTTYSRSSGTSQSSDAMLEHNHQRGKAEGGYWLLDPAEIQRLPVTRMIIRMRGLAFPILAGRLDYRRIGLWKGRWGSWRTGADPTPPLPPATRLRTGLQAPEVHGALMLPPTVPEERESRKMPQA